MATKKTASSTSGAPTPVAPVASKSKLRKGSGSRREKFRFITVYGPFKTRKTTSLSRLPMGKTKWICSDPNAVPTLRALGRLPHSDDLYEPNSLAETKEIIQEALALAEADPDSLGFDHLVLDSATQYSDMYQAAVAKETGQRFLGDDKGNNGWQQFNAEFGGFLDDLAALSKFCNVYVIVHAKAKFDAKKGEFSSFSLSPAMSERLGRLSNWVLLKDFTEVIDDAKLADAKEHPDDPFYCIEGDKVFEDIFYTKPTHGWVASVNSLILGGNTGQEPGRDIVALLEKDGLL